MKYKVGDKVKTNGTYGAGRYSIGTIKRVDDSTIQYNIEFDGTELDVWFTENEFTIIEQLPFPIGTKVQCSQPGIEPFTGIFQGQSERFTNCWAIDRDDGQAGGAQNVWWNFKKEGVMEEVKDTMVDLTKDYFDGIFTYTNGVYFSKPIVFDSSICNEFIKTYSKQKFMSIKNKIKMLMTGEPEKTLIKHGILTIDKELTGEGKQLFNDFVEKKFKDEFLKELYEVLKDEEVEE